MLTNVYILMFLIYCAGYFYIIDICVFPRSGGLTLDVENGYLCSADL